MKSAKIFLPLVLLTSIFILALFLFRLYFSDRWGSRTSGLSGALQSGRSDVIFVGSSHTRQSYNVQVIEERLRCNVFLIAYNGLDYVFAEKIIDAIISGSSSLPRLVVIDGYCASLVRFPDITDSRLYMDLPVNIKIQVLRSFIFGDVVARNWRNAFLLGFNVNNDLLLMHPLQVYGTDALSVRGGYAKKIVPGLDSFNGLNLSFPQSDVLPQQVAALNRMINKLRSSKIEVVCVDPPMPAPVESDPNVRRLKSVMRSIVEAANVKYYDGATDFDIHKPENFADSNHLSTLGRDTFTELNCNFIENALKFN